MDPATRTELSMAVAEGEVELRPELCEDLVFQVTLHSEKDGPKIARAVGIDRRTYNRYQNNQTSPNLETAVKIFKELGWEVILKKCKTH